MAFRLSWDCLLSTKRVRVGIAKSKEIVCLRSLPESGSSRTAFEHDYDRVVYSNSFKRLSRKTQVHPFPNVDYVRYRLTHSLEVSTIAVSLLRESLKIGKGSLVELYNHRSDAETILRTAGLAHDIGNPSFGHAGERAFQEYGELRLKSCRKKDGRWFLFRDIMFCDGNAQAFRLLARPDLKHSFYHGLSAGTLGAIIKYPYPVSKAKKSHRKMGAFESEAEILNAVMQELGLVKPNGLYARHPLSFLLEAADNICYILSDLEDAVRLKVLSDEEVKVLYGRLLQTKEEIVGSIESWRSKIADRLIRAYSKGFVEAYADIMKGRVASEEQFLKYLPICITRWMGRSKALRKRIYATPEIRHMEYVGSYAIKALLEKFLPIIDFVGRSKRCVNSEIESLIETICKSDDFEKNRSRDVLWWGHRILDYIMGMTDDYAIGCVLGDCAKAMVR